MITPWVLIPAIPLCCDAKLCTSRRKLKGYCYNDNDDKIRNFLSDEVHDEIRLSNYRCSPFDAIVLESIYEIVCMYSMLTWHC